MVFKIEINVGIGAQKYGFNDEKCVYYAVVYELYRVQFICEFMVEYLH